MNPVTDVRIRPRSYGAQYQARPRVIEVADRLVTVMGLTAAILLEVWMPLRLLPLQVAIAWWIAQAAVLVFLIGLIRGPRS